MALRSNLSLEECYAILGITRETTVAELKKIYHEKAKEIHPDHNTDDPNATAKFQKLNEAYHEILAVFQDSPIIPQPTRTQRPHYEQEEYQKTNYWHEEKPKNDKKREAFTCYDNKAEEELFEELMKDPGAQRIHVYYTVKFCKLRPNEFDEILFQIRDAGLYNSPKQGSRRLGHDILSILIGKLLKAHKDPTAAWLDTILHIANDPRAYTQPSYTIWWDELPIVQKKAVIHWTSKIDVEIVLSAFNEYLIEKKGYPPFFTPPEFVERKEIYEKIITSASLKNVKIFLGSRVKKFVQERKNTLYRPDFVEVTGDPYFSAIYFNLGRYHFIDGSHGYSTRIYEGVLDNFFLNDRSPSKTKIKKSRLTTQLDFEVQSSPRANIALIKNHNDSWYLEIYYLLIGRILSEEDWDEE